MIGLYAHHHGSGHLFRCRSIQQALAAQGVDSQVLSTRRGAEVMLDDDAGAHPADHPEITAGGTLHYAPYGHLGLQRRMSTIAQWVADHQPDAFYVDVSVEVALLVRAMGVPVVTLAMPGERFDAPHQLGYTQAAAMIAAWPSWVPTPDHLQEHSERLHPVGGLSRLCPDPAARPEPGRVVVLSGKGGDNWGDQDWDAVQRACSDYTFEFLGGETTVEDPTPYLQRASAVVAAAGQNSVADIAAVDRPAIILPQERPFDEQGATAKLLSEHGLAVVPEGFPAVHEWPELLARAQALGAQWESWQCEGAAERAAEVIRRVAARELV